MKFTQSGSDKYENPEPGTYPAVCIRVIDMGTQETNFQGEKKFARKINLVFELSELMSDGRPFLAMRQFTASLHDKSNFKKFLVGWRGTDLSPSQVMEFDPQSLIGKGCLLSLVLNGEYVNVDHASKLPKGMAAPAPVNQTIFLDLDNFKRTEFDKLSEKVRQKISITPEYKNIGRASEQSENPGAGMEDMESDLPW